MSTPQNDIGWCVEEAIIQILKTNAALNALGVVHDDVDTDVAVNRVVVKAVTITPFAPNPRDKYRNVREVEITSLIRQSMGTGTASDLYDVYGQMCLILENLGNYQNANIPALGYFYQLIPTLKIDNAREREDSRRKMIKRNTFLAILKYT